MNLNLEPNTERANFNHLVMDIAWFGLANAATSRFLSVYAIRLGASPADLGWITAIPFIVLLFSTALSGWWRQKFQDSINALFWPGFGFRLVFLLPAFTPFFPPEWQPAWLIMSAALPAVPQGISSTIFVVAIREAVPENRITGLMSQRSMWMNVTLGGAALLFGIWLEEAPFPNNYQIMFIAAFLAALVSQWHVSKVRVQASEYRMATSNQGPSPLKSRSFQWTIGVAALIHIAFFTLVPVTPLHLVNTLGATESFMAIFSIAELSAAALICLVTSRLVYRFGNGPLIGFSMIATALSGLILAMSTSLWPTLLAAALTGAGWTAATIGLFGLFVESTHDVPLEEMTRYSTAYHQMIFMASFIGPMIGSSLANAHVSLVVVMLVGAALRVFAGGAVLTVKQLPSLRGNMRRLAYRQR